MEKKQVFLQSFNILKCVVVGLSIVEGQKQPPEVFCKKVVLKNFTNFTGKQLCWSVFFNKVAGLRPATLLKRDSYTAVFL